PNPPPKKKRVGAEKADSARNTFSQYDWNFLAYDLLFGALREPPISTAASTFGIHASQLKYRRWPRPCTYLLRTYGICAFSCGGPNGGVPLQVGERGYTVFSWALRTVLVP